MSNTRSGSSVHEVADLFTLGGGRPLTIPMHYGTAVGLRHALHRYRIKLEANEFTKAQYSLFCEAEIVIRYPGTDKAPAQKGVPGETEVELIVRKREWPLYLQPQIEKIRAELGLNPKESVSGAILNIPATEAEAKKTFEDIYGFQLEPAPSEKAVTPPSAPPSAPTKDEGEQK